MAFCIEKFSAWFCFIVSTEEEAFKKDFGPSCYLPIDMDLFDFLTRQLGSKYSKDFGSALENTFDFEKYCCLKDYMEAIISKCLEISSPQSYLRFLMICSFIRRIIWETTSHRQKCFVFAKMVSQCLIELCNSHYNYLFQNENLKESFEKFCEHLSCKFRKTTSIPACTELGQMIQQEVIDIFKNLNCRRINPKLNCSVQEILKPTILAAFPKYSSMEAEQSASTFEYEPRIKEESSINESEVESWKEEFDIDESESNETSSKEEYDINEPESNETSSKEEYDTDVSEFDELSSKEESIKKECESGDTSSKEESSIREFKPGDTSSKEKSSIRECEPGDTSSKEESSISESESETFSDDYCMNESTRSFNENEEDSYDPKGVCKYCNMKCFQFVYSFLEKEFIQDDGNL